MPDGIEVIAVIGEGVIEFTPTPIVRCRDCRYGHAGEVLMDGGWKFGDCTNPRFKGSIHACNVQGNGFCMWGERRVDDGTNR